MLADRAGPRSSWRPGDPDAIDPRSGRGRCGRRADPCRQWHCPWLARSQGSRAAAALRIFGLLPNDLRDDLHALWQEFEAGESPDAIFARSIDRVQPVMLNIWADGGTWAEYGVTWDQLESRVGHRVARGAPRLWDWVAARAPGSALRPETDRPAQRLASELAQISVYLCIPHFPNRDDRVSPSRQILIRKGRT